MDHHHSSPHQRNVIIANALGHSSEALRKDFAAKGFAAHTCSTSKTLLWLVKALKPELIVSELRLSDGPNMKHLRQVRQDYPEIDIVVVTGHSSIATLVECYRIGIRSYLQRGSSAERILASLHDLPQPSPQEQSRSSHFNRLCWEYINRVVEYAGSISQAALLLGLDRRSLRRMLGSFAPHE